MEKGLAQPYFQKKKKKSYGHVFACKTAKNG